MLRVAIVGAGPAGAYAAAELVAAGASVDMIDRLPTPWGLVRAGVAPDHADTKAVCAGFDWVAGSPLFTFRLNVEVGRDVSHSDLAAAFDAVIYACGAPGARSLGIPGESLPGSFPATDFVGWYNGHPDFAGLSFELDSAARAVIVGNGNVALDVARILLADVAALRRTDIADHALEALSASTVREVVILGRRGPEHAAFTTPELLALVDRPDLQVVASERAAAGAAVGFAARQKLALVDELAARTPDDRPRIVLRFGEAPAAVLGSERVEAVRLASGETLETGLLIRSIGYRGRAIEGVPFDASSGTIPNDGGRVIGAPGVYTTGWIKRGPSGVIGTNKQCARETVAALLDDFSAGLLSSSGAPLDLAGAIDRDGWRAIDAAERAAGAAAGRPRVKLTSVSDLVAAAGR